jgi:2-polyprenyl-3-methyl-5-hydroxy-6-metoxy-1,4-benzoquinol methylase
MHEGVAIVEVFQLGNKLPFYWRLTTSTLAYPGVPEELDFSLTNDQGLVSVVRTPELLENLAKVYELDYNIGYIQEDYDIAEPFIADFRKFLFKYSSALPLNSEILEIGCGGAILLNELTELGFRTFAVDPSPTAIRAAEKYGFKIIPKFFAPELFSETFSLVFHSDVLEHAFDPRKFIDEQRTVLKPNGLIIISVPNAQESLEYSDISMAMHQHLQYFTPESLSKLLESAGFRILEIRAADYGGSIYCAARRKEESETDLVKNNSKKVYELPNFKDSIDKFRSALETANGEVGFYVPLRAMPYLSAISVDMKKSNYRFFDDTTHWHGHHFDGTNIPIESFQDILKKPPKTIFIMSLTFEKQIKSKISSHYGDKITIVTLRDILSR